MTGKEILDSQKIYEKYLLVINNIRFTSREIDVIACIMHGKNAKSIANFLSSTDKLVEARTIESHIFNVKRKISTNTREGIISFIEKSDKYKLVQNYYVSLLIQQKFHELLQQILILTKSDNSPLSFFIVLQTLEDYDINLLINKLSKDLQFIGITVSVKLRNNPNDLVDLSAKPQEANITINRQLGNSPLKQCIIYVLTTDKTQLDKQPKQVNKTNINYITINISPDKPYYFLFTEIVIKIFSNTNIENIIHKFSERYSIIENFSSIYPIPPPINKDIQDKTKNIYILAVSVVSILVFVIFGSCFFIFKPNINRIISSQGEESLLLTAQKSTISTKNLTIWNIPRQDHIFIGRENLLDDLYNKLHHNHTPRTVSNLAISACSGLGGIGKTQLALQYVNHTKHPYTLKVWFPAENVDHLYNKYVEFAKLLGYAEINYTKESIIAYVKQWLIDNPGWLLVYDNVNNYREIEAFLPKAGGYVILTTRQRHWPTDFSILPIDVMTEEESIKTLKTLIQRDIT